MESSELFKKVSESHDFNAVFTTLIKDMSELIGAVCGRWRGRDNDILIVAKIADVQMGLSVAKEFFPKDAIELAGKANMLFAECLRKED